jgi:hypothetical protein
LICFIFADLIVTLFNEAFLTAEVVMALVAGVGNGLDARSRGMSDFISPALVWRD